MRAQDFGAMQFVLRGATAQFVVGRGVPEEEREARGEGVVVEPSGLFFQTDEFRRTQHGGVGGDHRVGEVVALLQGRAEDGEEAIQLRRFINRPTIGVADEFTQQASGIFPRLFGSYFHAGRRREPAIPEAIRAA